MRVRTIRNHSNEHGDSFLKSGSAGPVYEIEDEAEAKRLIAAGYVERADAKRKDRGVRGTGSSVGGASEGDGA